jgi:hypothetical protein
VLLMVMMTGAKVILQDQAENSFGLTRQPGLASCGNPSGRENAPVGSVENPLGVEMGVAPKRDPLGPVTCGCLYMSVLLVGINVFHSRLLFRPVMPILISIAAMFFSSEGSNCCPKSNSKDK